MSTAASRPMGASQFDIPVEVKYLDGRYEKLAVRIRRVNTGFFRISAPVHMPPGRLLTLFYCGNRIDGSILYSNPSGDGSFHVGIMCAAADTRREARLPLHVDAQLSRAGSASPVRIKLVETSRSGFGFTSPVELAVGLPVCIEFDEYMVFAEIRFCTRMGGSYRAGCLLEEFIHIEQAYGNNERKKSLWAKLRSAFRSKPRTFETVTLPSAMAGR